MKQCLVVSSCRPRAARERTRRSPPRAGGNVTFVARVGSDTLGDDAISGFQRDGIDVRHVVRDQGAPSGVALIFIGAEGQNSIAVASGANANLSPADIRAAHEAITAADMVVIQLESPLETVAEVVTHAASVGTLVILNPAPARELPRDLLTKVAILTPNEHEAELLSGVAVTDDESAIAAADKLLGMGVAVAILTLGSRGALIAGPGIRQFVPAFHVTAIDTVAAGDVFNGALAVAMGEGMPLVEAVRFASAAAAISVTRSGAQPSAPTRIEIEKRLDS